HLRVHGHENCFVVFGIANPTLILAASACAPSAQSRDRFGVRSVQVEDQAIVSSGGRDTAARTASTGMGDPDRETSTNAQVEGALANLGRATARRGELRRRSPCYPHGFFHLGSGDASR